MENSNRDAMTPRWGEELTSLKNRAEFTQTDGVG